MPPLIDNVSMEIPPTQRYVKRIPLTCGLMIVSLLGFTAALDFNKIIDDYLSKNVIGNGSNGNVLGFMFGGCVIYLIVGLAAILAIILIWRGIRDWPLDFN